MLLNGTVDASWVRKRGGSGLFDLRLREETDHTNLIQLSIKFLSPKTRKSRDQILELSNVKVCPPVSPGMTVYQLNLAFNQESRQDIQSQSQIKV